MATIREADPDDARAIRRVARAAWHEAYGDILDEGTIEGTVEEWYGLDGLASNARNPEHALYVAADGGIVGFAHAGPIPGEDRTFELYRIYLRPGRWGEGIGGRLLDAVATDLRSRGVTRMRLSVLADNDVGVAFYEAKGFDRVETRAEGSLGVPEYVYARAITP